MKSQINSFLNGNWVNLGIYVDACLFTYDLGIFGYKEDIP